MEDYTPAKQAAVLLGIEYATLLARFHSGKVKGKKIGWAVFIHNDELGSGANHETANQSHLAKTTR